MSLFDPFLVLAVQVNNVLAQGDDTDPEGGGGVPSQPTPQAPPGIDGFATQVLGWIAWATGFCAVGSLMYVGIMMMVGRRNRSQMAADGLAGLPWIIAGLIVASPASAIASAIL